MRTVLGRLRDALNDRDPDAMLECFHADYRSEQPAHPNRGFGGKEQVRKNWSEIFSQVPDIRAWVHRTAAHGDTLWTEWEMAGARQDGAPFLMRGVVIFGVAGGQLSSARFYLEPVETGSGDVDVHTRRVVGAPSGHAPTKQQ